MRRLLRWMAVAVGAWVCGTIAGYAVSIPAFVLLPGGLFLGLAAGAVVAALAARAVGERVAPAGTEDRGRPLPVVLSSLVSLLLLGLPASAVLSGPGMPPIPPIPAAMAFAAAGAALADSRRRTRGPGEAGPRRSRTRPRRGRGLLPLLVAVTAPLVLVLGAFWLPAVWACSSDERAVYGEFPQYGGRAVEPSGNPGVGSCAAYYQTPDSEEEVLAYFAERLEERGWEPRPQEASKKAGPGGKPGPPAGSVAYRPDGFRYEVQVGEIDPEAGGLAPGTHVTVHVSHRDRGAIPPPGAPGETSEDPTAPGP